VNDMAANRTGYSISTKSSDIRFYEFSGWYSGSYLFIFYLLFIYLFIFLEKHDKQSSFSELNFIISLILTRPDLERIF
jgi:hypothetical protein